MIPIQGANFKPKKGRSVPLAVQGLQIYHPGYKPPKLMLILAAFADQEGHCGVPFLVVLWACRILANNKNGHLQFLNTNVNLTPPADDADDKILLPPGKYTYSVPGERLYPVCTVFRAWHPPTVLPERWSLGTLGDEAPPASTESTCSQVVKGEDRYCVVTGDRSRRETCHLVPKDETPWWMYHNMSGLTNNKRGINSTPNCLAMRVDLNAEGMDRGYFVFAPYGSKMVCICIDDEFADFATEYHLCVVDIPKRIHPLNLYVRFAWGLFKSSEATLSAFELDEDTKTVLQPSAKPVKPSKRKRDKDNDAGREDQEDDDEAREEQDDETGREEQDDDDAGREDRADDEAGREERAGREQQQHDAGGNTTQAMDGAGPLLSGDESSEAESEPSLDLCAWTNRDLAVAERMDAALAGRPLAPYEVEAGMYPGYSKALRLQQEYRKQHPEVSAVRSARVAYMGEDNHEQWL